MPSCSSPRLALLARTFPVGVIALFFLVLWTPTISAVEDPDTPQEQAIVYFYAQSPYDWSEGSDFDLDAIEGATSRNNAVYQDVLVIDYTKTQEEVLATLKHRVAQYNSGRPGGLKVTVDFDGGSVDADFTFDADFAFEEQQQPVFSSRTDAEAKKHLFNLKIEGASFKVKLYVHVDVLSKLGLIEASSSEDATLEALISVAYTESLNLYPEVVTKVFSEVPTVEKSNFGLEDMDEDLFASGTAVGSAFPLSAEPFSSAIIGGVISLLTKDEITSQINKAVSKVLADELKGAMEEIDKKIKKQLEARNEKIQEKVTPDKPEKEIKKLHLTPKAFLAELGGKERLSSQVSTAEGRMLTTQRFEHAQGDRTIRGVFILPRFSCVYAGNEMTGRFAVRLDPANRDVTEETTCDSLLRSTTTFLVDLDEEPPEPQTQKGNAGISAGDVAHRSTAGGLAGDGPLQVQAEGRDDSPAAPSSTGILNRVGTWLSDLLSQVRTAVQGPTGAPMLISSIYLGDNPETYISGHRLSSWKPYGVVSTSGKAHVRAFSIECPVTISKLRKTAILEFTATEELADRLGAAVPDWPPLRERFLVKDVPDLKASVLLDHLADPVPLSPPSYGTAETSALIADFPKATFAIIGGPIPSNPNECPHIGTPQKPDIDPGAFQRPNDVQPDGVDRQGGVVAPFQQQFQR